MEDKKVDIILFSGGLDSLCTALYMPTASLLYVDLGTKYSKAEVYACYQIADGLKRKLDILNLAGMNELSIEGENAYMPLRNVVLASVAAGWAQKRNQTDLPINVWMGGLKDDNVFDKTPAAFETMTKAMTHCSDRTVNACSMWWDYTKYEMVERTLKSRHRDNFLAFSKKSLSCYHGTNCGNCPSCFRKFVALKGNKIDCASWFKVNPQSSEIAKVYREKINDPHYDPLRREITLSVLEGN
jgi:7-cyano-7-deazaguanine synthase in queuosine biosynthesis